MAYAHHKAVVGRSTHVTPLTAIPNHGVQNVTPLTPIPNHGVQSVTPLTKLYFHNVSHKSVPIHNVLPYSGQYLTQRHSIVYSIHKNTLPHNALLFS